MKQLTISAMMALGLLIQCSSQTGGLPCVGATSKNDNVFSTLLGLSEEKKGVPLSCAGLALLNQSDSSASSTGVVPAGVSTANLQGMYKFEDNLNDSSSNARTGTLNGTLAYPATLVTGQSSAKALGPYSTANYVTFPASAYALDGDYTATLFMKGPAAHAYANNDQRVLIGKVGADEPDSDNNCHGAAYELKFGVAYNSGDAKGRAFYQLGRSDGTYNEQTAWANDIGVGYPDVYDGNTHFIAIRISGTTMKLWVDGQSTTHNFVGTRITSSSSNISLGACLNPNGTRSFPFEGTIDELYIFNRALTDTEVDAIRTAYTY